VYKLTNLPYVAPPSGYGFMASSPGYRIMAPHPGNVLMVRSQPDYPSTKRQPQENYQEPFFEQM
jgi:hypothetical protein